MSGSNGTTSVPAVSWTATGFVVPAQSAIVTGLNADTNAAFGGNLNIASTTPQGQLIASQAAIIGDSNNQQVNLFNNVDPYLASGRYQDAIGRIYFLTRFPAQPTTLNVLCTGAVGVIIPYNALIKDTSGNIYYNTAQAIIGSNGSIVANFAAQNTGPIPVPTLNSTSAVQIYTSVNNWNTVAVQSGAVGQNVESRSAFETRRSLSVAANAVGILDSIQGAVLAIPGVEQAYVTENFTSSNVAVGNVTLLANSLYVCVAGGNSNTIGQTIFTKKPPGCNMTGNNNVTVFDTNGQYSPPYPSYNIVYEVPVGAAFNFNVVLKNSTQIPATALAQVQAALESGFSGQDGGAVPTIGSTVYASRFYPDIVALGSWVNIIDIQLGCSLVPTAQFNANISGSNLTVFGGVSGTIQIGQFLYGNNVASGSTILSGSGSSWQVAGTQTVANTAMTTSTANNNLIATQINWLPSFNMADAMLTLI